MAFKFLKIDSRKKERKLLGAYIPIWMHEYLTLYALANGVSKSDIVIQLLEVWSGKKQESVPIEELIKGVVYRLHSQWRDERLSEPPVTFDEYKAAVNSELLERGLRPQHIKDIMKTLKR
jgi:hypothetical protein